MYLGKICMENILTKAGSVENILGEMCGGQIAKALMNTNQCIELQNVIAEELSAKIDMKKNRKKEKGYSTVFSLDNIVFNLIPEDLQLALHILQNNLIKARPYLCKGFDNSSFKSTLSIFSPYF